MEQDTVEDAGVKATTVVEGTKSSICPYEGCGKSFTKPSNLILYIRTHTQEKNHILVTSAANASGRYIFVEIQIVQISFLKRILSYTQLGNLTKHLRSHENAHLVSFMSIGNTYEIYIDIIMFRDGIG